MTDKYWDSDEVEGKFIEVILISKDGDEMIYWVSLTKLSEDEDEYDWAIEVALKYHNLNSSFQVSEEDAEAMEPFSRYESEFTFIN